MADCVYHSQRKTGTTDGSCIASVKCVNRLEEKLEFRGIPLEKFTLVSNTPAPVEWRPINMEVSKGKTTAFRHMLTPGE